MKRKLIRQGKTGLTTYLPKKWADAQGLQPGDEIEIIEEEGALHIRPSATEKEKHAIISDKKYDRTGFVKAVTAHYEDGCTQLEVKIEKGKLKYPLTGKKHTTIQEIQWLADRLIGFEIISATEQRAILRAVTQTNTEAFAQTFRRIFFLIKEQHNALLQGENVEVLHDSITKFTSYCLRMLSIDVMRTHNERMNLATIIAFLDKIADVNRAVAREYAQKEIDQQKVHLERIHALFELFTAWFFSTDEEKNLGEIDAHRIESQTELRERKSILLVEYLAITEHIQAMIKPRLGIRKTSFT